MLKIAKTIADRPYVKPAPSGPVVLCRVCRERPVFDDLPGTKDRCEVCWSLAAEFWTWNGFRNNALHHSTRR